MNASYSYGSFDDPQILRHSTAHHSEEWLVDIAKDRPEKACSIEIYDCRYYERMRLHWNGAGLLLHEFCHLVHQFCLGLDNAKVLELYQKADCSGKYNQTPRRDWAGCDKTHDMGKFVFNFLIRLPTLLAAHKVLTVNCLFLYHRSLQHMHWWIKRSSFPKCR